MLTEDKATKTILKRISLFVCLALLIFASGIPASGDEAPKDLETQFFCHYSKTAFYEGETVYAEYILKNTGKVPLKSAIIEDSALSYISDTFSLAPGEEKCISVSRALSRQTDMPPRARYKIEGSDKIYEKPAQNARLQIGADQISLSVIPEKTALAYRERAVFTIQAVNNSPFRYTACVLESPVFGRVMAFPAEFAPGAELTFVFETRHLTENTESAFTLTVRDENGTKKTFFSDEIALTVQTGEARMPAISVKAGTESGAPFLITITGAQTTLKNVRLTEKELGTIKEIAYLAANAETVLKPDLTVTEGRQYTFSIEWTASDETGIVTAAPVAAPFGTTDETESGVTGYTNKAFYAIVHAKGLSGVILYGCVAAIVIILTLSVILRIRKYRRAKREAREALSHTNKFAPVRPKGGKKEKKTK